MPEQYIQEALQELKTWQKKMLKKPSLTSGITRTIQKSSTISFRKSSQRHYGCYQRHHKSRTFWSHLYYLQAAVTYLIERTGRKNQQAVLILYKKTGAVEGGVTGAGGFFTSLADFPLLLGIKIKMLFDIAALYGFDVKDYRERLYMLYVFQLAFSSDKERKKAYEQIENWDNHLHTLPADIHDFDWQTFQQEYRDYIDIAKLAQLIPFIGAAVGAIANYKLINKLGYTARQAYRMRLLLVESQHLRPA